MSCFRCGKDLPELQTECDPPCDEPKCHQGGYDPASGAETLVINFGIKPDRELLADPKKLEEFQAAMFRFMRAIAYNFSSTGLNKFCKPINPPPR
ncbi:MAG TPA: hypothetical protein VHX90_01215 [Verrucomicrobiae bacterium]|jgi:hypothetical protein|nr:hypothetical protein [Verrucomicrobiae bacterium]